MTPYDRWTLRTENTSYTVRLSPDGPWAELDAWGPHGVEEGPSALDWSHRTHFITPADAAPAEYLPQGQRPFTGADLIAARPGQERGVWWEFTGAQEDTGGLRLTFTDDLLGLRTTLCYAVVPGTDVLHRWTELACTGGQELRLERFDSGAVNVPVTTGARLTYLAGQWSQEFQRTQLALTRGTFTMGSTQGTPGHAYAPWLAVQDLTADDAPAYGIALKWPGNWHITAQAEAGGAVRVRAGRVPHEGALLLAPGETLTTPRLACAFSADGLDGLSRVWHRYERHLAGARLHRPRKVLYNSWEATGFDVDAAGQLELAKSAADIGIELFVVDDGWFTGRADDTAGLGDWHPDPAAFPGASAGSSRTSAPSAWTSACGSNPRPSAPAADCWPNTPTGPTGSTAAPPAWSATNCSWTSAARTSRTSSSPPWTGCSPSTASTTSSGT